MIKNAEKTEPLSICIWGKNNSSSPNKFTYPVRCRIEEELAQAALSSKTKSSSVKFIDISLELSESSSPKQPYIGLLNRSNNSVGVGIELPWLVDKNIDEQTVQIMLGKPLLALLLCTFKRFEIPDSPFLKSLSAFPGWATIINSLSEQESKNFAHCESAISIDEEAFWTLIEKSKLSSASNEEQEEHMIALLSQLAAEDVREFAGFFQSKMVELYRWDLWAIAYIIHSGCSDDSFKEFRAWLIAQGREFYNQAIMHPEFIGEQLSPAAAQDGDAFHDFDLVAGPIYEEKTGYDMHIVNPREPRHPVGYSWNDEELPSIFPSVCKKFQFC